MAGASGFAAANVGLVTAVVVLMVHAWVAGRSAQLHGRQLLFATLVAAGLGLAMILLKDVVLTHVHRGSSQPPAEPTENHLPFPDSVENVMRQQDAQLGEGETPRAVSPRVLFP